MQDLCEAECPPEDKVGPKLIDPACGGAVGDGGRFSPLAPLIDFNAAPRLSGQRCSPDREPRPHRSDISGKPGYVLLLTLASGDQAATESS